MKLYSLYTMFRFMRLNVNLLHGDKIKSGLPLYVRNFYTRAFVKNFTRIANKKAPSALWRLEDNKSKKYPRQYEKNGTHYYTMT